jgi:hypothetical protein
MYLGNSMDKERVETLLLGLLGSEKLVSLWWNAPNSSFDYETPAFTWESDPKKVLSHILEQFIY